MIAPIMFGMNSNSSQSLDLLQALKLGQYFSCRDPSLGLATKARGCKVASQKGDPRVTSHAPGSAKSVRE
jgi:hypothetical protein